MAESLDVKKLLDEGARATARELGVEVPPDSNQTSLMSRRRQRKDGKNLENKSEEEVQNILDGILDGASFTLTSPSKKTQTLYFREGDNFYLESEREGTSKSIQTDKIKDRLRTWTLENITSPVADPIAMAASATPEPIPPVASANATELQKGKAQPTQEELAEAQDKERKTEERTRLVQDAQTPEELCDIVASFDSVSSNDLEDDVSGDELAHYMRGLLDDARKRFFDTYEEFEKAWTIEYPNVPKAYGIQEKFDVLLKEKMRREFSQPVAPMMTPDEEKESASKQQWDTFRESVKGKKSVVLASPGQKELLKINLIGDKWFDSKGNHIDGTAIREKLQNNWRLLNEEEEKAFEMGKGIDRVMETKEKGRLQDEKRALGTQIKSLEGELDDLRAKYVKKDYEETSVWKRLSRVLGRKLEPSNEENEINEKAKYQQKLQELLDVRLQLARLGREGDELKEAMAGELQYFITESKIKLYSARTEVKGTGYIEKVGNYYNDLVRKHPWVSAGIGLTLLGAGFASGGAAPATLTLAVFLKRAIATPGLFVTTDSLLGKASAWARDKSIKEDVEKVKQKTPEEMEEFIKAMNANCDKALLKCKVAGRIQKSIAALAAGLLFGHTAIAAYEHFTSAGITEPVKVAGAAAKGATATGLHRLETGQISAPAGMNTPSGAGAVEASPVAVAEPVKPSVEVPILADTALAEHTKLIDTFVNQDIKVVKGDSVWKISGRLADQMKLTGGARTHFIDALKDKFGDIQLQAGETINFGAKGIDREFIEKALGKSGALTAEQIHSIEANDAKIAEFARANPDITLTNEGVNQILHSNPSGGVSLTDVNGSRAQYIPSGGAPSGLESAATAPAEVAPSPSVKDIISQAPEKLSSPQQARLNDWYMQIFRTENSTGGKDWVFDKKSILKTKLTDIVRVSDGKMIFAPGFDAQQVKNFKEFSDALPKEFPKGQATLAEFVKAKPDITVNEYLARVAQNVKPGTRIGLYTTTN